MNFSKTGRLVFISALIFAVNTGVFAADKWVKVTSKNFRLIGNADEKDIRRAAHKLEQFRAVFTQLFDTMRFESAAALTVFVFKDEKSFRDFKPVENGVRKDWVSGFFQPGEDANYLALSLNSEEERNYRIIYHEYTHFLLENTFGRSTIPTWLSEGLAEYYEKLKIKDRQRIGFGKVSLSHLNLLQNNRLIPFEEFLKVDYSLLERQNEEEIKLFYAQSWALIHYLLEGNSAAPKDRMNYFLELLKKGKRNDQAFFEAFNKDFRQLEGELTKYIARKNFETPEIKLKNKLQIDREMISASLSAAESQAFLGDLLYRMERFDEAEIFLSRAVLLDPGSAFADISLGLVKMKKRDFAGARKLLEKAVSAEPENYAAHYNYALVLSREEPSEGGIAGFYAAETADKMRRSLRKAIRLKPDFAESYNLLAVVAVVRNEELDEALALLEQAPAGVSENHFHILRLSELYLLKKDFEKSSTLAENIFEAAADAKTRELARQMLEKIESYKQQLERADQLNRANPYLIKAGKTLNAQELDELYKRIEIDSINENLRKLKDGEQRITGRITQLECAFESVIYSVESEDRQLKFINKDLNETAFFTYRIELKGGAVGCEADLKSFRSIITYIPASENKDSGGRLVAVEFVPDYFVLSEANKENK